MSSIPSHESSDRSPATPESSVLFTRPASLGTLPRIDQRSDRGFQFRVSQQVAGDLVALADMFAVGTSAAFVAWLTRVNHLATALSPHDLYLIATAIAVIAMLAFRAAGLHQMKLLIQVSRQASRLLVVWGLVSLVAAGVLILFYDGPPLVLLAWLCLTPASLLSVRAMLALAFRLLLRQGALARRAALIGAMPALAQAAHLVTEDRLTKLAAVFELPAELAPDTAAEEILEITDALASGGFDDVVVLVPSAGEHGLDALIDHLGMLPLRIALLPIVALQSVDRIDPGEMDAHSVALAEKPVRGWSIICKTVFDYVTASVMLALFALPMLAIAIAIRFESPGPVIFRQQRTGLGGRVFRIWKFRSMHVLEDGATIRQAEREDWRVTRVGRIIRRLSLDELPQIFNVLAGDMSVVGPRPHARAHDAYFARLIPDYRFRFRVKPGITGHAQIHGCRGETKTIEDMARRIAFDIEYAEGYNLWRDIAIVLMTPFFGILSANSY